MNKIASVLTGISSLNAKLCLPVIMSLALLTVVLFVGACSDEVTEVPFPDQPIPETRNWLFTVFGTGPNDIYAGGARGALFHYDGNAQNQWNPVDSDTKNAITRIWGSGDGTLYATGHGGTILRQSGGAWSGMSSGTTKDLYSIGRFQGDIFACGFQGALRKLNGSSWGGTPGLSWIMDESGAPTDTLEFSQDIASLTTVNSFFICGAYIDPRFVGTPVDMEGTKGGVFAVADHTIFPPPDTETGAFTVLPDWILRPLSGEQIVEAEWMLSTTSDPADLSRNYLGTSEGWLFQLSDARGDTVWTKFYPSVTESPGGGIQDIWLDLAGNVYMVTDEGAIVYQTVDYNRSAGTGLRIILYDGTFSLTGIWGTDPGNFYVVGYIDDRLMRCSHDPVTGDFNLISFPVEFPAAKALETGPTVDKFGRPLN